MAFFRGVKRFFHSYKKQNDYKNNQILAYKKELSGMVEIIYWMGWFEVYYRPKSKRYGELIAVMDDLEKAFNFLNNFNENILSDTANGIQKNLKEAKNPFRKALNKSRK